MKNKITSFATACKALKIKTTLPDVSLLPKTEQKAIIAHYKLVIIAKALNAGWKPDYSNNQEAKYYPWHTYSAGSGWSFSGYLYAYTDADVGPRLVFKTYELAEYAGKQFIKLYNEYYTFSK